MYDLYLEISRLHIFCICDVNVVGYYIQKQKQKTNKPGVFEC